MMLSRYNRPSHSSSNQLNEGQSVGSHGSRVNRSVFQANIGNYYRNRPASIAANSSATTNSFMKKRYCLLMVAIVIVAGFTLFIMQFHLNNQPNHSSYFSSLKDYLLLHSPNGGNLESTNDFLRKPLMPIREVTLSPTYAPTLLPTVHPTIHYDPSMFNEIHFVHIPKCGGTTMTAVLRQIQCALNPIANQDCCTNPGFCDWHAHRRCQSIKGCINHFPNRKLILKSIPSFVVFREPISRILSAWFYRGHSPNNDFFQVRPYFKDIRDGKLPKVTFAEYIEMPEYQNIQTRMLGADSFPYRNITITDSVFEKALEAVDHFFFIGLQEEFDLSARAFARSIIVNDSIIEVKREREQTSNRKIKEEKAMIKSNQEIMARLKEVNHYDIRLYQRVVERFCQMMQRYPDLYQKLTISCQ